MPEVTEPPKVDDPPKADPPAADPPKEDPPADPPKGKDGQPFDPERAQRTIDTQREEANRLKAELKEAKARAAKADEYEAEKLSDQEKLQKRADEAEAKVAAASERLQRANLIATLSQPGIVNARAAAKLIEGVEYDESGEPTNLGSADDPDSLLGKFLAENAFLRGNGKPTPPSTDGREGAVDTPPPSLTAEEAQMAEALGMTAEEYAKNK